MDSSEILDYIHLDEINKSGLNHTFLIPHETHFVWLESLTMQDNDTINIFF